MAQKVKQSRVIQDPVAEKLSEYASPYWLRSVFGAPILQGDFGDAGQLKVDFDVKVGSGESLIHPNNRNLLLDIYYWLGLQTHIDAAERVSNTPHTARVAVSQVLTLVDYLLLRADVLKLNEGFAAISGRHMRQVLMDIPRGRGITEWAYGWNAKIVEFIADAHRLVSDEDFASIKLSHPAITSIDAEQRQSQQNFTEEQIVRARAALISLKLYKPGYGVAYKLAPNTVALAHRFYPETLRGKQSDFKWPVPLALCFNGHERYIRECANACDAIEDDLAGARASQKNFESYRRRLLTLQALTRCGRGVSPSALETIADFDYAAVLKLKPPGRTFTVPPDYIFFCLDKGIEFFIHHGEHVLKSYSNVVTAAATSGKSLEAFANKADMQPFCEPETLALGVKCWSLRQTVGAYSQAKAGRARPSVDDFFLRFRACEGLVELVQTLYGAISLVVGALMAAREGELDDLPIEGCLSETRRWLKLATRKSGTRKLRRRHARPIIEIAVEMVELLQQFHHRCSAAGMSSHGLLFTIPGRGKRSAGYSAMDAFLDFIDAPKLADGSRYYVRQHMLRRFFALMFFCKAGLVGLEALRWHMRHTDMEHLYHYISEALPGAIMRTIKSLAAAMMVRQGDVSYASLAEYLRANLGTTRFDVMSEGALAEYIESLQADGVVVIDPVFLDADGNRTFDIGVQIWDPKFTQHAS